MSVCLSVRPHGTTRLPFKDFHEIRYSSNFFLENLLRKLKYHQILQDWQVLYTKTCVHLWHHRALFFLERGNASDRNCKINENTKRVLVGKPEGKRPLGRPRRRLIISYGIIINSISTLMCTVWHVDKYKITFQLVLNHWTNEIV